MKVEILFSRENESCIIPSKKPEDAGYDLYIDPEWFEKEHGNNLIIYPNEIVALSTGIRSVIPSTHYFNIAERGSTGIKGLSYRAGIFDSGYRGIWQVVINNTSNAVIVISNDDTLLHPLNTVKCSSKLIDKGIDKATIYPSTKAIAQAILHEVPQVTIKEVPVSVLLEDYKSERGEGRYGSSGK